MTAMPHVAASENLWDVVEDALSAAGLNAVPRAHQPLSWAAAIAAAAYIPVYYTDGAIDYQIAYQRGHAGDWTDCSMVVEWGGEAAAAWPVSISKDDRGYRLSSFGLALLPPLFAQMVSDATRKKVVGKCLDVLEFLRARLAIADWESAEPWIMGQSLGPWYLELMSRGSISRVRHDLYVDLSPDIERIKTGFRKSYRPLITSGSKLWQVGLLRTAGLEEWAEFRQLHLAVAGRVTRSEETWRLQHEQIAAGQAFLVYLRNASDVMVGGGLFSQSRDEGTYSVGAYDRSLFDRPLGHVVQYHAVAEMKRRGLRWYKIGTRSYASDIPSPTPKEITISNFKQGFASHVFPCFLLSRPPLGDR